MLRPLPFVLALTLACGSKAEPASDESSSSASTGDEAESESSSGGESESETGPPCTDIDCSSSFVVRIGHSLDLSTGPYQILVNTSDFELICSIPAQDMGSDSCFGNAYVNIEWDTTQATITLQDPPFYDAVDNPEGIPVDDAEIVVNFDGSTLYQETHTVDHGEPNQPDPCGPVCWDASVTVTLP